MTEPPKAEPSGAERRKEPRFGATHPIILEWQTQEGELHRARGTTRDLALGGVYCYVERPLPEGVPVDFNLVFPAQVAGGQPVKLHCGGHTLRSEKTGQRQYGVAVSIDSSEVIETLEPSVDPGQHRIHARILPSSALQAEYPGMRSTVRDISPAGAFLEDERPLPIGRLFRLRLSSERLPSEIELAAVVRRSEPHVGMAVEFVALSPEAKEALQKVVQEGSAWQGPKTAFPAVPSEWGEKKDVTLEEIVEFVRERAVKILPQLEVLACNYKVGERAFSLHLRDPVSQAELLLPLSERWVRDCQVDGDCSRLERALGVALHILDLRPLAGPKGH